MSTVTNLPPGSVVEFVRGDGAVCVDITRGEVFQQHILLEPYARNEFKPAVVLTNHSWTFLDNIIRVIQ